MPGAAEPAVGRPQPEHAAQRRRHADRAVGVGAERQRHQRRRHRRRRAARRAAGDARRIVRIAGRAVMAVLGREAEGVLVHVERADQHRARRRSAAAPARRRAPPARAVAVDARAGDGRQSGDVVEVLDREGHAGERPGIAPRRHAPHRPPRASASARSSRHRGERVDRAVARRDPSPARASTTSTALRSPSRTEAARARKLSMPLTIVASRRPGVKHGGGDDVLGQRERHQRPADARQHRERADDVAELLAAAAAIRSPPRRAGT